jgi:hypothetical protein
MDANTITTRLPTPSWYDDCQLNGGRLTNKQCTSTTVLAAIVAVKSMVAFGEGSQAFLLITAIGCVRDHEHTELKKPA